MPLLPTAAESGVVTDPLVDPLAAVADVPAENAAVEDSVEVGTPSGSVPVFVVVCA